MLKQVQHDAKGRYRLQGMGSPEENRQSIQGFNASEVASLVQILRSRLLRYIPLHHGRAFSEKVEIVYGEIYEDAAALCNIGEPVVYTVRGKGTSPVKSCHYNFTHVSGGS